MNKSLQSLYEEAFPKTLPTDSKTHSSFTECMDFTQESSKWARDSSPVDSGDNSNLLISPQGLFLPMPSLPPMNITPKPKTKSPSVSAPPLYSDSNDGPFVVFIESLALEALKGNLHRTTVGRIIASKYKVNIVSISPSSSRKITVVVRDRQTTNNIKII